MLAMRLALQLPLWKLVKRTSGISDEMMRLTENEDCVPTLDRAARHCAAFGLHLDEGLRAARERFLK